MRKFLLYFLVLGLVGCGYTTGSLMPSQYRTIFVDAFKNKVPYVNENTRNLYIPLLETKITSSVINRYSFDGHLRIGTADKSDLVLKGDLVGYQRDELRTDDNLNAQEYRITIIVSMTLVDNATGEVVWSEPSFAGETTYFTTGPQAKSEDTALVDALTDLSRRIVERTVENW